SSRRDRALVRDETLRARHGARRSLDAREALLGHLRESSHGEEVERREPSREAGRSAGRERVVRAEDEISERNGRERPEEERAVVPEAIPELPRILRVNGEVLGPDRLRDGERRLRIADDDQLRVRERLRGDLARLEAVERLLALGLNRESE